MSSSSWSLSVSPESLLVHTVTLTGVSLLLSYRRRRFNVSRPSLGSSSPVTEALVGSSSLVVFWFQVLAVASRRGSWTVVGSSLASSLVLFWGRVLFVTQSPLRFEIVNGVTEVEGIAEEKTAGAEEDEEKGVPAFWLNAMKNNEVLAEEISEHDEGALKFLKDIKWSRIDNPKGFKLEFYFDTNPYFTNTILTKTYHMIDEDEPILEKAIGFKSVKETTNPLMRSRYVAVTLVELSVDGSIMGTVEIKLPEEGVRGLGSIMGEEQ
ncbi:Nucleosome assembly protein [Arachis hypogaea]|uniref:Nucleosome assembly protein n=1 Tax=Arachis hypogaea TaxID=3818 RepID=A0A6B9V3C4_ARAHY|nr:Nucleosome assembly protein [Arachis hypogaea]